MLTKAGVDVAVAVGVAVAVAVGVAVAVAVAVAVGVAVGVGVGVDGVPANSNAPMSLPSPPLALGIAGSSKGRDTPRWSLTRPKLLPLSRAGLFASSAMVSVGPPLF